MMSDPRVLLLDEPSLGLAPMLVNQIRDLVVQINESGTTILLVEQNANMALSISDHGYIMETGKIVYWNDLIEMGQQHRIQHPHMVDEDDSVLSYPPLCHIAERVYSAWSSCATGVQVNFAESIETVPQNLAEVQPRILFGVPRIWEKIAASVGIRINSASPLKRRAQVPDRPGRHRAGHDG